MKNKLIIALLCASAAASPLHAQEITAKQTFPTFYGAADALDKNGEQFFFFWLHIILLQTMVGMPFQRNS